MTAELHDHTHRPANPALLAFGVIAAPLVWGLHLLASYAFASHVCFPAATPLYRPPPGTDWLMPLLIAIDVAAVAIAALAAVASYGVWRKAGRTGERYPHRGRTRFLAFWGMMMGAGFLIAILFDLPGVLVLRPC